MILKIFEIILKKGSLFQKTKKKTEKKRRKEKSNKQVFLITKMGNICLGANAKEPETSGPIEVQENGTPTEEETEEEKQRRTRAARRGRRVSVSAECDPDDEVYIKKVIPKPEEAYARISAAVNHNFLFSGLDESQKKEIFDAMAEVRVTAGEDIIKQGDQGDYFYVLDSGEFDVYVNGVNDNNPVLRYKQGGSFGELALMYNTPRAATVRAVTDSVVWAVDRATFRHIILESRRQQAQRYEEMVSSINLLQSLEPNEKSRIADVLEPVHFNPGDVIIHQGDEDRDQMKFYIIEQGTAIAKITSEEHPDGVVVGEMKEGDYFGEKVSHTLL